MNSSAHVFLVSTYSISRASGVADHWSRAKKRFFLPILFCITLDASRLAHWIRFIIRPVVFFSTDFFSTDFAM
jgi:hypothetical protein